MAPKIRISLSVMIEKTQSITDKTFPYAVLIQRLLFGFYFDSKCALSRSFLCGTRLEYFVHSLFST